MFTKIEFARFVVSNSLGTCRLELNKYCHARVDGCKVWIWKDHFVFSFTQVKNYLLNLCLSSDFGHLWILCYDNEILKTISKVVKCSAKITILQAWLHYGKTIDWGICFIFFSLNLFHLLLLFIQEIWYGW